MCLHKSKDILVSLKNQWFIFFGQEILNYVWKLKLNPLNIILLQVINGYLNSWKFINKRGYSETKCMFLTVVTVFCLFQGTMLRPIWQGFFLVSLGSIQPQSLALGCWTWFSAFHTFLTPLNCVFIAGMFAYIFKARFIPGMWA